MPTGTPEKCTVCSVTVHRWLDEAVTVHRLFSSGGERGLLFLAVRGLLIAVASPVAEPGL